MTYRWTLTKDDAPINETDEIIEQWNKAQEYLDTVANYGYGETILHLNYTLLRSEYEYTLEFVGKFSVYELSMFIW